MSGEGSCRESDLSSFLRAAAVDRPAQPAYIFADGAIRFDELDQQSDMCARGLAALGIERGDRVALLVRPSRPLFVLTFGLLRRGAVPVLIDPGIGRVHLARCLAEAGPSAFIGVSVAHAARVLLGWAKDSVRTLVTVGARWFWGGASFEDVMKAGANAKATALPIARPKRHSPPSHLLREARGRPRGRCIAHQILAAQALLLRDHFGIRPGERDLATFPLFAFFDPVWQATGVIPRMDFTRPGSVYPPLHHRAGARAGSHPCLWITGAARSSGPMGRGARCEVAHLEAGPLGGCARVWPSARTVCPALGTRCRDPHALRGHRGASDLLHFAAGASHRNRRWTRHADAECASGDRCLR